MLPKGDTTEHGRNHVCTRTSGGAIGRASDLYRLGAVQSRARIKERPAGMLVMLDKANGAGPARVSGEQPTADRLRLAVNSGWAGGTSGTVRNSLRKLQRPRALPQGVRGHAAAPSSGGYRSGLS